jgi:hypothetical protein
MRAPPQKCAKPKVPIFWMETCHGNKSIDTSFPPTILVDIDLLELLDKPHVNND